MKKMIFALVTALFCAAFFAGQSTQIYVRDSETAVMRICEYFLKNGSEEFNASAENIRNELLYADAEMAAKYSIIGILTKSEKTANDTAASGLKKAILSSLSNGKTINANDFYSLVENHLPESIESPSENSGERVGGKCDFSPVTELLCDKLSEKYEISADGRMWYYSDNYIFCMNDSEPEFIIRSVRGNEKSEEFCDLSDSLASESLFGRGKSFSSEASEDGLFWSFVFRSVTNHDSTVSALFLKGFRSPVMVDFSSFVKKNPAAIENT